MSQVTAAITAVGGYVPPYVLTNQELESMVETNDEWIRTRTGIEERRILKGENQGTSVLGVAAVEDLMAKKGLEAAEIDLLICATVTPDMLFPSTATLICDKIGAKNAMSYDISAACSGFIYAVEVASKFIVAGGYKKIVVVGADKMSSIINYKDRNTCILFGDGAGAVLMEPNTEGLGVQDSIMRSDGVGKNLICIKAGGSSRPASEETIKNNEHFFYQDGRNVFKHAVKNMSEVSVEIMERNQLTADSIAYLIPHQANKRIIEAVSSSTNVSMDKITININRYGNTTGATIPLCLWEWEQSFKKKDNIILTAFGGGFTWGAIYLNWAY